MNSRSISNKGAIEATFRRVSTQTHFAQRFAPATNTRMVPVKRKNATVTYADFAQMLTKANESANRTR